MEETITNRVSGGETKSREEFLRLRARIQREEDVAEVLALSWLPAGACWLYLIRTPFATWPKFVVGFTDQKNLDPQVLFRCGHEENAREFFQEQNVGDHV